MSVLALLAQGGLPANANDLMTTGQVRMKIEPNTKQPQWVMDCYCASAVTVGFPYVIWWTAKRPTAVAATSGVAPFIGIASATTDAAGFSEFIVVGYAYQIVSTGSIAVGQDVEVCNAGVAVKDAGAAGPLLSANGFGHAQAAASGNLVDVWMYGRMYVTIAAS